MDISEVEAQLLVFVKPLLVAEAPKAQAYIDGTLVPMLQAAIQAEIAKIPASEVMLAGLLSSVLPVAMSGLKMAIDAEIAKLSA